MQGTREDSSHCRCYVFREEHSHENHQSQNQHQRVILRETSLCGPEQRRHQTRNESGNRIDEPVDEILVHAADDEPTSLDPAQVEAGEGGETVILQVYDRLVEFTPDGPVARRGSRPRLVSVTGPAGLDAYDEIAALRRKETATC